MRVCVLVVTAVVALATCTQATTQVYQPCAGQADAVLLAQPGVPSQYVFTWSGVGLPTFGITSFKQPVDAKDFSVNCSRLAEGYVSDVVVTPAGVEDHQSTTLASLIEFSGPTLDKGEFVRRTILDTLTFKPVNMTSSSATLVSTDNLIAVTMEVNTKSGISKTNPHNFFATNSFSVDLVISGYTYNSTKSRLAMEIVTTTLERSVVRIEQSRDINDEYSPSIFRRTTLQSTDNTGANEAHHAWKPVVFGNTTRKSTNMTVSFIGELAALDYSPANTYPQHIITASYDGARTAMNVVNVTFSTKGDKATAEKIIAWGSIVGPGKPFVPAMSTTLLATNITSYGVTIFAFIAGSIYLLVLRATRATHSSQTV
ncbi:hypothetical protein PTSG_07293 [Salpingoeca rosetta]|uniref:DOMON domain-containing protein n=1 Tax=Salpingoeca rosetta (strain ATCC 50818 / BSB-021) TaxID=946362 RepID=F2UJ04_SALR5|nr:uncharacterized protein PTSG_07293 [Salpingoeca rosetta]EGD76952.1 hypothetical protein PTSG_07293 [Salpingoeca rosetta]|eukprot:XP_004990792.1 hypothetical protein PTSG_07293 [Salpingoeca rosetta]